MKKIIIFLSIILTMCGLSIISDNIVFAEDISVVLEDNVYVKKVYMVEEISAAITTEGDLYCWGHNEHGQLGSGTKGGSSNRPVKVLENVTSFVPGINHCAAITTGGDLYCWGYNMYGQVGNDSTEDQTEPYKVLENVKYVSLGYSHSGAVTTNGDLYCWGSNDNSQIGDGTRDNQYKPIKIMNNISKIVFEEYRSAAIKENGDLYCWGGEQTLPVKIMDNVSDVFLSRWNNAAITTSRDLYCWGDNDCGQIGNGTKESPQKPEKVLDNVISVSLGYMHSAAITTDGDLYCWGYNADGEVGNGTTNDQLTPQKIMENIIYVSLGNKGMHSAAITTDGDLYCWGYNDQGQIGVGTREDQKTPTKIMEDVKAISMGRNKSAAITNDGDLYCWGYNSYGEIGHDTKLYQVVPIKVIGKESKNRIDISQADVTLSKDSYIYDGNKKTPLVTNVVIDGISLIKDKDYNVTYSNNIAVGTADVFITGIGDYKGSNNIKFKIVSEYGLDLKWGRDNFSFINSPKDFGQYDNHGNVNAYYDMDYDLIDRLNFSNTDKKAMKEMMKSWGGCCFGMSVMVYKAFLGQIKLNEIENFKNTTYSMSKPSDNKSIKNAIGLYQASCGTSTYHNEQSWWSDMHTQEEILHSLFDKLCSIEERGTPIVIDYAWVSSIQEDGAVDDNNWSAHAVLAYGIETEGAPYIFDGKSYAYRVRILNPNNLYTADMDIEIANKQCLYLSKDLKEFYIPEGGTREDKKTSYGITIVEGEADQYGEAVIQAILDESEFLPPQNSSSSIKYAIVTTPKSSIYVNGNRIDGYNGTCDGLISRSLTPNGNNAGLNLFFSKNNPVNIKIEDDNQKVSYDNGNMAAYITAGAESSINFTDDSLLLDSSLGNYNIDYVFNNTINNLKISEISISGEGNNKVLIKIDDDGLCIEGDKLRGTKIETPTDTITIDTNGNSFTIIDDGNNLSYVDNNTNYQIIYNLNGGVVSGNPTSYKYSTNSFSLNEPTKPGYIFMGWTGSNGKEPQTAVTIKKGTTGNLTYTANWKKERESSISEDNEIIQITDNNDSKKDQVNNVEVQTIVPEITEELTTKNTLKKNKKITVKKGVYKIISSDENGGTLEYVKPSNKNIRKVTVPSIILINGKEYRVISIKEKAFKNNKKLKQVDIGKNVKKIGRQAFYNCKKLNKLVIRTKKLTNKTVGNNAFKGMNKNVRVYVVSSKISSYKKLLKKKGLKKRW